MVKGPSAQAAPSEPASTLLVEDDSVPETGVRRVLADREQHPRQVRWGAIIAGLFLGIGTQILLGLFGIAVALSAAGAEVRPGPGVGVWLGIAALVGLFLGGFAASRLSGATVRSSGALTGVLTWAASTVAGFWLFGIRGGAAMPGALAWAQLIDGRAAAAWYAFAGALLSLLAAVAGGVLGATWTGGGWRIQRTSRGAPAQPPQPAQTSEQQEEVRRLREQAREQMHREHMEHEDITREG